MARSSTMTSYGVSVNLEPAIQEIEKLQNRVKDLTDKMSLLKQKMSDPSTWGPNDTNASLEKQYYRLEKELNGVIKTYEQGVKRVKGIDSTLETISGASYDTLTSLRTTLTNSLKRRKRETDDEIKAYEEAAKRLQKVRDEIAKRDIDVRGGMTEQKAKEVVASPKDYSQSELQDAIKVMEKLRDMQVMGGKQWKEYATQVENASKVLDAFKDKVKLDAMTAQFKDLGNISEKALSDQKKYWQEMVAGAANGSKELEQYEKNLAKVVAEEQKRTKEQAGKVMNNLTDYSVTEIKEAIKATEQLRDAQKPGSKAWAEYAAQVKNASDYLDSFKNKAQLEAMNTQFKNLGKLSADALAEQKKYWQSMVNGAANGSKELEQYRKILAQVTEEERKRSAASVKNVMANPAKYSVNEIKEAIKVTEQLRDAQQPGGKQWKEYATQVENANKVLESFKDKAKMEAMLAQFRSLGTLSKSAIAEQKKFWQAMADGAAKGSKELETYEHRLKMIQKEENLRARSAGKDLANDVLSGSWTGTVGEAKEAVKVLKEYKDTLSTTDTAGIKRVDKAISELNSKTKLAEAGFKSTSEALNALVRQTKNLGNGNFKGSIAELEEMRRKLITIRETQDKVLSARDRDRLTKAIQRVDKELGLAKGDLLDIDHILANMRDTPLKTLERAAQQLQSEIRDCSEATTDFTEKAAKLRRVNAQVDKLKKSFKEKESVISRTAQRLAAYVAIYGGFNFVIGKIKEVIQANLQLSDSFADIQKTTGLTAEQVKDLSKSIDSIDTRTSQQQLHELAAVAGQLGLKSQTDILGFVKASNMISVSLNELGSEGTSSLMKIATLTGEASSGTEQALLKIGSAINELTANSAATAGPIVDLMNRMGGVASQAGLTSAQMAAIGATADALGQSMEITGTSMNKFVTTLMSSSDDIAYALNMDAKALRDMLESGNTMEAIVAVFERMNKMKGMGELAGVMGELGSEGARMTQVLTAMAKNVNFLKAQIDLSTEAYKEADSIQNEYNIKNENALAIWQRIGNMIKELFVNSFFVDILTGISRGIHNVLSLVIESEYFFKILASSIAAVTAALYANSAAWVKNLNAMGLAKGFETLMHTIGDKFMAVWDTMAGAVSGGAKSFAKFTKEAWAAAEGTNAFKKATDMLGTSLKKLGSFLSRNWLTITIAALAALVAWMVTAITRTTELTRAIARYRREIEEEKNQVDALFTSLNRLNNTEADRAKIIDTINRKYGDYLGFMLSEKDSAEKLAAAHKLINSELERRMALNLQSTLQGKANNVYAEKYEEETTSIERIIKGEGLFNSDKFKGRVSAGDVNSFISTLVNDAVTAAVDNSGDYRKLGEINMDKFWEDTKKALSEKFDYTINNKDGSKATVRLGESLFDALEGNIEDLLEARVEYMEDIIDAERTADLEMGRITKNATKDRQDMLKVTEKEIEQLQNTTIQDSWTEEQTQEHYSKLLNALRGYVDQSETIRKSMTDDEKKLYEQSMIEKEKAYKTYYDKIAPLAGEDPWGKNLNVKDWKDFADVVTNLDTSSADALVSAYKQLTEDTAKIPSNAKAFYKMFEGTGLETKLKLQDPKDIATQVHNWAEQIKNKLKDKYGRNTSGAFIFDSDGGGGGKKTSKQMYDGWLAALEAYYNERETIIRQRGMEQNKLESEIARELEDLNAEKLASQRELEEGLLDDLYKGSTFDPKKFKGVITGTDYFANLTLESMRAIVSAGGPKLDAVIRKNLTDRMVKLEEQAYKIKQRIEKILLEDDFSEQVAQQYLNSLDQLGLLFNIKTEAMSDHSEEEGERRLAYMREWSKESYSLTAKDLQDKMEANAIFGDWVKKRTSEDYEALLIQLRKFHDDQEEAERKAAERRKKIFDNKWKYKIPDSESQENQTSIDVTDSARNIGLKMNDKVIEDLQERIKIEGNTIKAIHKRMDAEITAAKVSMHTAEIDKKNAEQTGLNVKERTEDYNKAKEQYESLISSRERYLRESSERIATHEQAIQDRIWEIRNANSGESREMINLLQAEIEKEQERVKLIHNRMDAEITAAKISMQTAEIDKKNAEQTGFNIKERTEEYIKAKAAYEELVAKLNSLIAEPTRKMEEYSQILAGKSSKETWNSLEESNANIRKEEADLKAYERFNELGLVSDYSVDEAQIELYRAKIKASQDYIEQIKKEMEQEILLAKFRMEDAQAVLAEIQEKGLADGEAKAAALQAEQEYQSLIRQQRQMTLDSENNIAEQRQLIAEKEMEIEKRKMDTMQQYVDTLSDFAQQMGEAAWGSVEDRQEAGKALLANVLKISKDLLQTYLIEVSTRKMMNDVEIANERYKQAQLQMIRVQSLASTGATMIGEMEAGAALSAAQIELNAAEAASKEAAKKGWIGLAIGAAISVALSALLGAALGRINKAKGEVAAATGASSGRLATGMLTYKEGNYPVLGNDGQVYNAKYEGAGMKTGIYGGGAHFGIFSEKKPEAIIDGDTTQRLILNHPDIWQSIVTLSKTGRLDRGMRTFASGNINELARTAQEADATATAQNNEQMLQMQATMAATQAAVMQLTQVLNQGIHAKIDMYGDGGMYKSMKKAESFASKRGYR